MAMEADPESNNSINSNKQMDHGERTSTSSSSLSVPVAATSATAVIIEEAIIRMGNDPPPGIEFLCSKMKKISVPPPAADRPLPDPVVPNVPDGGFPCLKTRKPRYHFQTSYDQQFLMPISSTTASASVARRSHSIHVISGNHHHHHRQHQYHHSVSGGQTSSSHYHHHNNYGKSGGGLVRTGTGTLRQHSSGFRRSTIHRFTDTAGNSGGANDNNNVVDDDELVYVPKESWLTSIYIKMPKSKMFCRFQLKLLNLPLFASTVRYLEETATGEDFKNDKMLQSNSFLYAVFDQFVPHNRILLQTLSKHVRRIRNHEILAIIEFNFLRINNNHTANKRDDYSLTMRHANKRENLAKNKNQKFVPYDYNRVVLHRDDSFGSGSDYINASHIDSLLKPNGYIVAQGPTDNTVGDFWRMIWQQNIPVVVMLTKVYEFIRVMCIQYWPSRLYEPEIYDGRFEVTLVEEDQLADYVCRTMKLRDLRPPKKSPRLTDSASADTGGDNYRTVYQLHFQSWNVTACPYSDSILKFRRRVKLYQNMAGSEAGPLLVHCSNGCGRSGTYVCLDANLDLSDEDGVVDIFNYAKQLRQSRANMIESVEQYRFIYETIEEWYVCGKTWFHVNEISQQMKHKSIKNKATKRNHYQEEFEKLMRMTSQFSIGDCAGGHRLENRDKNRDVSIVPPDNFRPYLTSVQSLDQSDYINAVFVDGYSRPREYIVTEWPLKKTVANLWSLIYDHDCNTVVVLGGVPPHDRSFVDFWPKDSKPKMYGPMFTVETMSCNSPPQINAWVFRVTKKITSLTEVMAGIKAEPKIVQLFEFLAWPYDYKVPRSTNALVELIHMVERWRQRTSYGPVLVISGNGKSRVGVYCAANFAIEQVVAHEEIDIFNAVKTVRRHRSALIATIMEYKYCYDLTLHYVSHYLNKDNQVFKRSI